MFSPRTALVAVGAVLALTTAATAQDDYYAGKTVSLVVPYDPGGSTDTNWRLLAPFLSKHLPGNPEVVVQNMSGGSGNTGANFVYERARPDGLTLLAGPWNSVGALTDAPGMRFDYTQMHFIGGFPDTLMTYARKDVVEGGMESAEDVVDAGSFTLAGLRPDSTIDLTSRLSLDLLELDYNYVTGYRGGAQRAAAVMSGEADASGVGYVGFINNTGPSSEGELVGLYYHSPDPIPAFNDGIMDFPSFYEKVKGEELSGEKAELLNVIYLATGVFLQSLWAPPETDEAALEALKEGYAAMMDDPELAETAKEKIGAPINFVTSERGSETVDKLLNGTSDETVAALEAYIAEGQE